MNKIMLLAALLVLPAPASAQIDVQAETAGGQGYILNLPALDLLARSDVETIAPTAPDPGWLDFLPALGAQATTTGEGETGGVVVSGLFRLNEMDPGWPDVIGLSFTMNAADDPQGEGEEPPPGNVLGLEAWWLPLRSGPIMLGFGGGAVFGNFGAVNTDTGGLYGLSIMLHLGEIGDLMVTIADHTDFQDWSFNAQARVQYVRDFGLGF